MNRVSGLVGGTFFLVLSFMVSQLEGYFFVLAGRDFHFAYKDRSDEVTRNVVYEYHELDCSEIVPWT